MTYRVLDLFSGLGAFSLGLERTGGFKTVGFCEIDPFCRRVLAKHWPDVPCHDDITTREFMEGEADVITAGWPCQDISFAGRGAGLAGERSGLFREVVRAIRVVRPKFVLLENVAALLDRGMGEVLGALAGCGMDAEWDRIPAHAVGLPHDRPRLFIVAHAEKIQGLSGLWERGLRPVSDRVSDWKTWLREQWGDASPLTPRTNDGAPDRMGRAEGCGNSLVPQIPEIIGRAILSAGGTANA
jgi:DNA (cytosine-5)-methyltransferase 1